MKTTFRLLLASSVAGVALLSLGCSSNGSGHTTVGVSYGYPYYGPGWGYYPYPCCWDDDHHHRPDRPNKPDNPNRPGKPGGPSIQPIEKPSGPGRPSSGPSIQPVNRPRPPSNIGRPSISRPMRAPRAMPRGGGRRR
jgi:hypothetical protein